MDDEISMKTKTGDLDFHIASAACYVPIMMINYIAPAVFLFTEPKEHRQVRFHAVQSLLLSVLWIAGTIVVFGVSIVLPIGVIVIGSVIGMEDIFGLIGMVLQLISSLVLLAVGMGGFVGLIGMAVLTGMQKDPRIPMIAGFADRLAGDPGLALPDSGASSEA